MSSKTMHEGELEITLELVQKLLDQQFPQYASLTLVETDLGGTMNRIFFQPISWLKGEKWPELLISDHSEPEIIRDWKKDVM